MDNGVRHTENLTWISGPITFTSHSSVTRSSTCIPIILAQFSRHTSYTPSIWERRHPSGKLAYVKSHMGVPRTKLSKPNTLVDKTMVFVYCDLVAPQFVTDQNLRTLRIIHYTSIVGEHRFQNIYYIPVEKSLSGRKYSDATDGRFDSPFRGRNITRKNGTTFSARSINTRDVSSYRHYRS